MIPRFQRPKRSTWAALALALVAWLVSAEARAEPIRVLVAVGHRSGLPGEAPLKHAVSDATRVRDVFTRLGGVRPEHAILLAEPTAAAMMAALDRAAQIARTRRADEVTLLFYFSGHGDRDKLHLGAEAVALRDVDAKLGAIPAALRIVVADACRTADVRAKGATAEEPFAIRVDPGGGATGVVRIHASADGEVAQESDELGGAIFTHYWVTGLSGAADADGDARVTLSEAYSFAYGQTLYRSTRASGVVQRPAAQFDLKEAAPIVLTQTSRASGIRLPRAADMRYLVYALGSRSVVAELWGERERAVTVAVAPGKYVVHRRGAGRSAAVQIDVARGEQRELRSADFQPVNEEVLARKGGDLLLRPDDLGVAYLARTSRLVSFGSELSLRFGHEWDGWAISVAGLGGFGSLDTPEQESSVRWLGGDVLFERRLRTGAWVLRLGVGPTAQGVLQTLRRADAARVARAGLETDREFRGVLAGGATVASGRLALGEAWFVALDLRFDLLVGDLGGRAAVFPGGGVGAGLGLAF